MGEEFIRMCMEQVHRVDSMNHQSSQHHLASISPPSGYATEELISPDTQRQTRSSSPLHSTSSQLFQVSRHSSNPPLLVQRPSRRIRSTGRQSYPQAETAVWSRSHKLPDIVAGWSHGYLQKVISLIGRDTRDFSEFLKQFLSILLVHQQLMESGFFYASTEVDRLRPGSFLLRHSSDQNCLFAMSFGSSTGYVKSTRIIYDRGEYFFDCSAESAKKVRRFPTPLHLVEYYFSLSSSQRKGRLAPASSTGTDRARKSFVSVTGDFHTYEETSVALDRPFKVNPGSLMHLCRLTVNRLARERTVDFPLLRPGLKDFLLQYTFTC